MAFSLRERQIMGIHGLLPPFVTDQDTQVSRVLANFRRWDNDLDRYIYVMGLQDRNEKLFYRTLMEHVEVMMPVVYTPTVGLACQKYGLIYRKPRGLFITIHDKGHIYEILCNWPEHDVRAIVVTDGQRILGLGDLGAYGMGIPVGKLALYTALAGIKPQHCLPIVLDVGTNNKTLLEDPMYIGLRQPRVEGDEYDDFIDEFMEATIRRYGQDTLVQFEDFGNHNAFRLLERYRDKYCTFNDDIQGTAAVALAGILASLRITEKKLSENTFVFFGAGEASIGIAKLVVMAMEDEGTSAEDAMSKIWLVDSKGLVTKNRPSGGLNSEKEIFAKPHENIDTLVDVVKKLKPSVLIGAAAVGAAFTDEIIQLMASNNKRPVIFALSNPTSKAECTAEQAYTQSEGRAVFASGSPFHPVEYKGKTYHTGQGNNSYIFPGVALGVILCGVRHIPEDIFLRSAQALADQVTKNDLSEGRVYPPLSAVQDVSVKIAVNIADFVYEMGMAARYPEPKDKEQFIRSQLYSTDYEQFVPKLYDWPGQKSCL
ncbi:NADP-dependent malic enzyme-like [Lineus longissimus]|uniref:NADP-dependent malic enzyme-like n=1 Tax=Lineus longissimus TaxID=88925 RepID=UPI00315D10B0